MNTIQFSTATQADIPRIVELFSLTFGKPLDEAYYRARFWDNPFGACPAELAWDGTTLVGHYGCCMAATSWGGSILRTAQSMTTMTHPKYEGRGLFRTLLERLYARLAATGVHLVFGFPNHRSHHAFVQRARWEDVLVMHFLNGSAPEHSGESVSVFPAQVASAASCVFSVDGFCQPYARSDEFLMWRYGGRHFNNYFLARHEASGAAAIFKAAPGTPNSADLLEVFIPSGPEKERTSGFKALLAGLGAKGFSTVHTWLNLHHPIYPLLERLEFKPAGPLTYFGLRRLQDGPVTPDLTDARRWAVGMGDSDVF